MIVLKIDKSTSSECMYSMPQLLVGWIVHFSCPGSFLSRNSYQYLTRPQVFANMLLERWIPVLVISRTRCCHVLISMYPY